MTEHVRRCRWRIVRCRARRKGKEVGGRGAAGRKTYTWRYRGPVARGKGSRGGKGVRREGQTGGRKESDTDTAGAAPGAEEGGEDSVGPEPDIDSPHHAAWMARLAAIQARALKKATATPRPASEYPERPKHWMHYGTLAFCFFGRPSGKNEDLDLRRCNEVSGPDGDRTSKVKTEKKGRGRTSSSGGSENGSYDSESGPSNPLSAAAVNPSVGAGESQSRRR